MTQREIIKNRLDYSRGWLNSVLPRLTEEKLTYAPAKGMPKVSEQLVEIISVEAQLVPALRTGQLLTNDELAAIATADSSLDTLLSALISVRDQTLECLNHLTEDEVLAEVTLPQWYGAYWPKPSPLGEHFRNVAEHEFYHVGQLISYLWSTGDNPYDW